eukprot:CAMPEP_0201522622 /NCGR_PEP_ID=MMETSP0161_2-20130828/18394_1 /ASSEMBLY_ACC=CAM_ASM_000251 /TAXON_ID=180227 /ORGANISM="Neoparamoeba aestuarina, Strain SoJaBio B1-5/56/2" /LENGTH=217 /DNA_ID=CAMNT_0047921527 /DNA_START=21 /DNA_END=674 /DNA_ORIENTATION=-
MTYVIIQSADPFLGKVPDKSSLSQQTLMELFIDGITNKETICGPPEASEDLTKWPGLSYNDSGEIIGIHWQNYGLEGSIDLQWLPNSLEKLILWGNRLTGTLDLTVLPDTLTHLSAHSNRFSGSLDLTQLPKSLRRIELNGANVFSGTVDLTQLPPKLGGIWISGKKLVGETDFSHLPVSLTIINIDFTNLSGEIHARAGLDIQCSRSNVKIIRASG